MNAPMRHLPRVEDAEPYPAPPSASLPPPSAKVSRVKLRSWSLWLLSGVVVVGAHAGVFYAASLVKPDIPPALETVEMTVIAEGDPVPESTPEVAAQKASDPTPPDPTPQPEPQPTPPDPTPPTPEETPPPTQAPPPPPTETPPPADVPPPPADPVVPPPPAVQSQDATAIAPPPPDMAIPPPPAESPKKPEPEQPKVKPKPVHKPHPKPVATEKVEERLAQKAQKVGLAEGKAVNAGMTKAAYVAIINAQINEHRFYPEAARSAGITGHVVVGFTIGPNGTASGVTIIQSSGSNALDEAARQAVRAVHAPPPPGGPFTASKSFSFNLN